MLGTGRNRLGTKLQKNYLALFIPGFGMLVLFFSIISVTLFTGHLEQENVKASSGYVDLSELDFRNKLANISPSNFSYYRNELYTPEDFHFANVNKKPITLDSVGGRFDPGRYGTYRLLIALPDKGVYGLSSYSAMYSQRIFINGVECSTVGVTGKTEQTSVPQTKHYTVFFAPNTPLTEIIIQFSNFVHQDYGGIMPLFLGSQEKILQRDAISQQRIHILIGSTIIVFLFFLGMFFFFHNRSVFLWFSLSCLSIGIRMMLVEEKVIMLLFPRIPWKLSIGLEYITLILMMFSFLMYIHNMFKMALHHIVIKAFGAICLLYALVVLITPPIQYTKYILWFQIIGVFVGIYVVLTLIYNVVRKKDYHHPEHILILSGALAFIIFSILDIQMHRSSLFGFKIGFAALGMIILIVANMIALVLQFSRSEAELDIARQNEKDMQRTNELLDKMSRLKSDFLANISHEMRTPLTIMASYAGLTLMQMRRGAINDETLDHLGIIKREAIRLGGMVEQLKEVSLEKERQLQLSHIEATKLFHQVVDFCSPICYKNGNRLSVDCDSENIFLWVNIESMYQTLMNLVINANRHTRKGTIHISIYGNEGDFVTIKVSDNGEGIDPKIRTSIFQRGVSGACSSGLGLAISKEIIEEHGGKIWVEEKEEKGATIAFTLPKRKEGMNHERS